jgi:hypothetical protein
VVLNDRAGEGVPTVPTLFPAGAVACNRNCTPVGSGAPMAAVMRCVPAPVTVEV